MLIGNITRNIRNQTERMRLYFNETDEITKNSVLSEGLLAATNYILKHLSHYDLSEYQLSINFSHEMVSQNDDSDIFEDSVIDYNVSELFLHLDKDTSITFNVTANLGVSICEISLKGVDILEFKHYRDTKEYFDNFAEHISTVDKFFVRKQNFIQYNNAKTPTDKYDELYREGKEI